MQDKDIELQEILSELNLTRNDIEIEVCLLEYWNHLEKLDKCKVIEFSKYNNVQILGESLVKDIILTMIIGKENISLDKVLENPSAFLMLFKTLKDVLPNDPQKGITIHRAITKFNMYYELANEIANSQIDEKALKLFETLMFEKHDYSDEIQSINDLGKFPELRYKYFENKIGRIVHQSVVEEMLGMTREEYVQMVSERNVVDALKKADGDKAQYMKLLYGLSRNSNENVAEFLNHVLLQEILGNSDEKITQLRKYGKSFYTDVKATYGKEISDSLTKVSDIEKFKDIELENGQKVRIYELDGQDYNFFVHCGILGRTDTAGQGYLSGTYISGADYYPRGGGVHTFAFDEFNPENTIGSYATDNGAISCNADGKKSSIGGVRNVVASSYMMDKKQILYYRNPYVPYNEVTLSNHNMTPSAIIVTREPTEQEIQEALNRQIPIVKISLEKYKEKRQVEIEKLENKCFGKECEASLQQFERLVELSGVSKLPDILKEVVAMPEGQHKSDFMNCIQSKFKELRGIIYNHMRPREHLASTFNSLEMLFNQHGIEIESHAFQEYMGNEATIFLDQLGILSNENFEAMKNMGCSYEDKQVSMQDIRNEITQSKDSMHLLEIIGETKSKEDRINSLMTMYIGQKENLDNDSIKNMLLSYLVDEQSGKLPEKFQAEEQAYTEFWQDVYRDVIFPAMDFFGIEDFQEQSILEDEEKRKIMEVTDDVRRLNFQDGKLHTDTAKSLVLASRQMNVNKEKAHHRDANIER